ncbi:sporulation integral membrane protein YlbJ [Paenibacillus thalictri]|uniref:Sporulation integral membrane protein YlbJ n=1 Tax=Paenibacillus thalictri TaxID=2527873 RepID=A0A4Q9DM16_9BACL|nr:sporulation integral membrane protein YlbJ [Paenibacillus thalictri]TBL73995.1 sporulation integral membrane protein YlbJ [Paenibacillus thalictri]
MTTKRFTAVHLVAIVALPSICLMIVFPHESLNAALKGVSIWWDVLFPALLPFLVIAELMLGLGIVHFFGTLLDPLMRPLYRVPGIGGFVMAMGFASGYPVAAKLTSQLWEQKLVTRAEGERLVGFATTSDPIFLIGAVSVGFFHDVSLAPILAIAHYGTAALLGLFLRFHGAKELPTEMPPLPNKNEWIGLRALKAMHAARLADGRPLGAMLQQAVRSSLQLIMVIGGLVVFFSVIMEIMTAGRIMSLLYMLSDSVLRLLQIPQPLSEAVINGLFEVTLGAKAAGEAGEGLALVHKAAIAAFVLSWSGLSVHAQIVSLLHHTNLRYMPFLLSRLAHGLLATAAVYALWEPLAGLRKDSAVFLPLIDPVTPWSNMVRWIVPSTGIAFAASIAVLIVLFLIFKIWKKTFGAMLK